MTCYKEKCKLLSYVNKVLRKVCRPKKDEVSGQFRRLSEELCDTCRSRSSILIVKPKRKWTGYLSRMHDKKNMYIDSVWNLSEDGITRRKFEDNIKMNLQKLGGRLVSVVLNFRVLLCEG